MKTSRLYKCLVTLIMVVFCVFGAYGVPSTRYEGTSTNNHLHLGLEWQSMKGLYGYYNNARFRDALLAGTFFQQDPLAEKYYPYTPYHYGANNPNKYTDKTGEALDLVWDLGNVIYDIYQAVSNHIKGNHQEAQGYWKDAAFDIGAAIIPGVPAGATKVFKYTDNAIDISKNTKRIVSNTVETNTSKNARFIGDSDGKIIDIQSTPKGSYIQPMEIEQTYYKIRATIKKLEMDKWKIMVQLIRIKQNKILTKMG